MCKVPKTKVTDDDDEEEKRSCYIKRRRRCIKNARHTKRLALQVGLDSRFVLSKKTTSPCANCGLARSIGSSKTESFERIIC